MKLLDKKTASDATKLVIFMVVTILATGLLVVLIGNITFSDKTEYKAEFVDATGVTKGDDVRIAGVKVGSVKGIEIVDRDPGARDVHRRGPGPGHHRDPRADPLPQPGRSALHLAQPAGQRTTAATWPTATRSRWRRPHRRSTSRCCSTASSRCSQALSPQDINQLSFEIVQVFQGEGGTVEGLLGHTASVTNDARGPRPGDRRADRQPQRDPGHHRRPGQAALLAGDQPQEPGQRPRRRQGRAARLARLDLGALGRDRRPGRGHPQAVRQRHQGAARGRRQLGEEQGRARSHHAGAARSSSRKVGRTAIYGSWFNFYLCEFTGNVRVAGQDNEIDYKTNSDRCSLP